MKIIKTKINFKDERGEIRDILIHASVNSITYLTCTKGAVRGNHYHKKTLQRLYILSGSLEMFTRKGLTAKIIKKIVHTGDLIAHEKNECHAFKALEFSEILQLGLGKRAGEDYEKDTYKLKKPMI